MLRLMGFNILPRGCGLTAGRENLRGASRSRLALSIGCPAQDTGKQTLASAFAHFFFFFAR